MARHAYRAKVLNVNGERIKSVGYSEANALVDSGAARRISRPKAPLVIQLTSRDTTYRTESSISLQEMEANAEGAVHSHMRIRGRRPERIGNFVDRSMTKIELWPDIGDTKAVRVGPRHS